MPDPSAYIPGYQHDLFISYAQVDNQTLGGAEGWVHTLVDNLKELLSGQLGRKEWGDIWLDRRIEAGEAITAEVEQALDSAALMVVIMSEGYLESPWCRHERERFLSRLQQQDGGDRRIFLVHKMDIEQQRQPEPFRDRIGISFFHRNRASDPARTLGFPLPNPGNAEDRPYYQKTDDLSRIIADRLRTLRQQAGAPAAQAELPATLVHTTPPQITSSEPSAIFLAETTPDLEPLRDNLSRQLDQSSLIRLPPGYYARDPEAFAAAMRQDLAASLLFVQILGRYSSVQTPDLPHGYEGLQLQLAEQSGLPILRWHDPDLDLDTITDRTLMDQAEITLCGFEEFKRMVEEQALRQLRLRKPLPVPTDNEALVLISAAERDEATAYQIGDTLDDNGIGYEVASPQEKIDQLIREQPFQGVIVIYGECERDWAKAQVRQCRSIMLRLKELAPACALFDPPQSDKPRLGIKFPKLHLLSELQTTGFQRYLQALHEVAAR